ncbi:Lrp/AsnC family transcriptional regulator [Acinetobacter bereziniae]|uniref:Lrp/AsnC family transcriptional regulator n=1 Tax=Acinetobacter bereziniae TaxID=106648 RepID=UPI0029551F5F|nr:Lrp/AsnC family transcriptional regulator [Acinetobacter bereziniae]MDV8156612.1 Lrp/AsnC family transcriptional regulator [Acinetobacter bereziniae]
MSKKALKKNLDNVDQKILSLLQENGALSNAELGDSLSMSVTPCWRRRKKLEEEGVIIGYQANLDRKQLGYDVLAFVQVRFGQHTAEDPDLFDKKMLELPQILSCHKVTGEADYILMVVAEDLEAYGKFVEDILRKQPGIISIQSSLSLREVKHIYKIPI